MELAKKFASNRKIILGISIAFLVVLFSILVINSFIKREIMIPETPKDSIVRETFISRGAEILYKWNFTVVEYDNIVYDELQNVLSYYNIKAYVSKYNVSSIMNGFPQKPQVIIVNLLDEKVKNEIISSKQALEILYRLSRNDTYVLFLSNDTSVLNTVSRIFDPPLSIPSQKMTNTILYKNGNKEFEVMDTLNIIGRTYKVVGGRSIPVGIMGTEPYQNSSAIKALIYEALEGSLENIVYAEVDFESKGKV